MLCELKVLVTDGEYKHTVEIVDEIMNNNPLFQVTAVISDSSKKKYVSKNVNEVIISNLKNIDYDYYDVVIPVSAFATSYISKLKLKKSLIVSEDLLNQCFDKYNLSKLCKKHSINYPETIKINKIDDIDKSFFPCVIKSRDESELKFDTIYITEPKSFKDNYLIIKDYLKSAELIQQKMINGNIVRGYFGLFIHGDNYCEYMHERIRTWPISGGSSTSAKSITELKLKTISRKFLKDLNWHGPVMLEYMFNSDLNEYTLIEINPKFWGSLGLGMKCGLKFGSTYCKAVKNIPLKISKNDSFIQVSWPLDGDIVNIIKQKKYKQFFEYFRKKNQLIVGPTFVSLIFKVFWTIKKIFVK